MSKYLNRKTVVDGIVFDSKKEAERYRELVLLQKAGLISELERQKKILLIPAQYGEDIVSKSGKKKRGPLLERACYYIADFVYNDENGKAVYEDVKGLRTKEYRLKRKLALYLLGIAIVEV